MTHHVTQIKANYVTLLLNKIDCTTQNLYIIMLVLSHTCT